MNIFEDQSQVFNLIHFFFYRSFTIDFVTSIFSLELQSVIFNPLVGRWSSTPVKLHLMDLMKLSVCLNIMCIWTFVSLTQPKIEKWLWVWESYWIHSWVLACAWWCSVCRTLHFLVIIGMLEEFVHRGQMSHWDWVCMSVEFEHMPEQVTCKNLQ